VLWRRRRSDASASRSPRLSDIRWTEGQICAEVSRLEYRAGSAGVWRLAGVGVGVAIEYETRIVHPVEYK